MPNSPLPTVNMASSDIVSLAFLIVLGIYVIFTAIFYYHWNNYATDPKVTRLTIILYFATTIPLIVVMGILSLII